MIASMQLLWVISSTILLYAGAVPLIRLRMRRQIVDPVYPRYGLVAKLSVNNQSLGASVNTETPLMYFIVAPYFSTKVCRKSVFGCLHCHSEDDCKRSGPPTAITLRDGSIVVLVPTEASFDISEQDSPMVIFGSEVASIFGPDVAAPSSVLGLGFSQDHSLHWPLIDQLVKDPSGYIKSRSFSLYLGPGYLARGEVLLGGVDPDKFMGPLALMPVVGEGHWMLHLLAVYV
ncbi:hypothetical protein FOZ63_005479, partial [Perkinsus olseni]